jgi:hypothetical protein
MEEARCLSAAAKAEVKDLDADRSLTIEETESLAVAAKETQHRPVQGGLTGNSAKVCTGLSPQERDAETSKLHLVLQLNQSQLHNPVGIEWEHMPDLLI